MYIFKITSEVGNRSIGEDFGSVVPKSVNLLGSPGSAWSGFFLAPKALVTITPKIPLSEALEA